MARLPYLTQDDLKPADKDLLKRDIALYRILSYSPDGARAFGTLGRYIRFGSKLDGRLRELAILQVGYLARAPYEYSHHIKIGYDFGVTKDDIEALIADTEGKPNNLEPLAKTVLRAAREMSTKMEVSDATFAELKAALSDEHIIDLMITIAFYNGVVRFLGAMQIDVEPEYQKYLDEFPLPKS